MNKEKYSVSQFSISNILGLIESKSIAIPEIQRPFVWKKWQVRNLIDSLYNGYPTGYLIIWQNPNVRLKNGSDSNGKKILIDGQQRLTALMASIIGEKVIDDEYKEIHIKIAYNPFPIDENERFAVQDSSHLKSKKWISDISTIFKNDFSTFKFINEYCKNNPEIDADKLNINLVRLKSIVNRQIGVLELSHDIGIEEVTEIFVRINSAGKRLNEADFAMSKIASDEKFGGNLLRKAIDYFCHLAVEPNYFTYINKNDKEFSTSEYLPKIKWLKDDKENIYDAEYSDMLRVSFMHKFNRGKLADLVSLLSGRNFETRIFEEKISEKSFKQLKEGVLNFVNEYNYTQFVLAIKSAGFISNKLINSNLTLDFAYTLFLILSDTKSIPKNDIKRLVQKWYILTTLTSRYINSPESVFDKDLRVIKTKGFIKFLKEIEDADLSETFWNIGLVQDLETSAINSPYFNVFVASQIHSGDRALFSTSTKIHDLINTMGDVHHIFPKEYLKQNHITDRAVYNQVANYVYLDTQINISIGKKAPSDYFGLVLNQCKTKVLKIGTINEIEDYKENLKVNCIPEEIVEMSFIDYENFLLQRRKLIAQKIKKYYYMI